MTTLLVAVHVASCIVLILVVLLQAGRGADMGAAFGGASTPMFGSGSSTNPLARMTTITAVLFMTTALFLAVASARRASVFDSTPEPLAATPHAESAPPEAPPASGTAASAPIAEAKPMTIPATGSASPAASDEAAPQAAAPEVAPQAAAPEVAPQAAAPQAAEKVAPQDSAASGGATPAPPPATPRQAAAPTQAPAASATPQAAPAPTAPAAGSAPAASPKGK